MPRAELHSIPGILRAEKRPEQAREKGSTMGGNVAKVTAWRAAASRSAVGIRQSGGFSPEARSSQPVAPTFSSGSSSSRPFIGLAVVDLFHFPARTEAFS